MALRGKQQNPAQTRNINHAPRTPKRSMLDYGPARQAQVYATLDRRTVLNEQTGCVEWQGSLTTSGYGQIGWNDPDEKKIILVLVHRVSYERAHGRIPYGMTVDHLCSNKRCVTHLEAVTHAENSRRAAARRKAAKVLVIESTMPTANAA